MNFPTMSLPGSTVSPATRRATAHDLARQRQEYAFDDKFSPIPLMCPVTQRGADNDRRWRGAMVALLGRILALRRSSSALLRALLPDALEARLRHMRDRRRAARAQWLAYLLDFLLDDLDTDPTSRAAYEELLLTVARLLDRSDDSPFPYGRVPMALFDLPIDAVLHDTLWRPDFPGAAPNQLYIVQRNKDLTGVLNTAAALRRAVAHGAAPAPPQSVSDWAAFFPPTEALGRDAWDRPMPRPRALDVRPLDEDAELGWQRLGGANPLALQRLVPGALGSSWPDVAAELAPRLPEILRRVGCAVPPPSWEAALAAGRLYVVDYSVLSGMAPAEGQPPRGFRAALGLFCANVPERPLLPIAIRLLDPSASVAAAGVGETVVPGEAGWRVAKLHLQVADLAHHEVLSHLWHCHLLLEGITLITRRTLAPAHPVAALLRPHLQGVLANLMVGRRLLLSEDGMLDQLLPLGRQQWIPLLAAGYRLWQAEDMQLPRLLARRGLADADALPTLPLRDDGLPIWHALLAYVSAVLAIYYPDEGALQADPELASWQAELLSRYGAPLSGEPPAQAHARAAGFRFDSRASLAAVLTGVIFTSGPTHAAVNFGQWDTMLFAANQPGAIYAAAPGASAEALLPPAQQAIRQLEVIQLLAGRQFGRLGFFRLPAGPAESDAVNAAIEKLQADLAAIEAQTVARDAARGSLRYPWLYPSRIPNSANV